MSGSTKVDMAAIATSSVITADQLMRALEASHEGKERHAKKHLGYAVVGAAVALGAYELLRRDEQNKKGRKDDDEYDDERDVIVYDDYDDDRSPRRHHRHRYEDEGRERDVVVSPRSGSRSGRHRSSSRHKRRLAEEIVGMYALGQEMMGHKKHHIPHLVAEALGAIGAYKDISEHIEGME
ncbi:hypothetical protein CC78DRAFT_586545 [Lojkania enalia]|uniref:Uncharacterized protein n=1 Tax=Lojkania enalia TaxID=147567 RepID=A0A9P4MY61_9PLEO|nr:hypothetical protein CC78DRAFT_586545 [Didymosphaeria enalia]